MCPLQIILGTEVHHRTGSQFIIDLLQKLGFSSSVKDVQKLERSLCLHDPFETPSDGHLPLYSGDNADVQIHTNEGHNTLHVMGMIRSSISNRIFTSKKEVFNTARTSGKENSNFQNDKNKKGRDN